MRFLKTHDRSSTHLTEFISLIFIRSLHLSPTLTHYFQDKLHYNVWILQSQLCDKVWEFSTKHDLNTIFNSYPDIPSNFTLDCECGHNYEGKDQCYVILKIFLMTFKQNLFNFSVPKHDYEAQELLSEINALELELESEACDLLKEDLANSSKELQICEKESPEIIR